MGGSYYIVRDIFQELKLKPKAHMPIVAKALSEVSSSVPGDASSHSSPAPVPTVEAKALSEVSPSVPADTSSHFSPAPVPIVEAKTLSEVSPSVPDDASSHFSPVVVEPEFQVKKKSCFGVISLISLGFSYQLA